eukprot:18151-Prymnesium_polylepis.1
MLLKCKKPGTPPFRQPSPPVSQLTSDGAIAICTDAPTIGSGWRLYGMDFYGRRRPTGACV